MDNRIPHKVNQSFRLFSIRKTNKLRMHKMGRYYLHRQLDVLQSESEEGYALSQMTQVQDCEGISFQHYQMAGAYLQFHDYLH